MTKLIYLENSAIVESFSTIVNIHNYGDFSEVILDETIFYPKGGGQPSDTGVIMLDDDNVMNVLKVYKSESGEVRHQGTIIGNLSTNSNIKTAIDKNKRKINSSLHSYGHLIDDALWQLQIDGIEPGKGYHYPDGPSVEYTGELNEKQLKFIKEELPLKIDEIISKNDTVNISFFTIDELKKVSRWDIMDGVPLSEKIRAVEVGKNNWMACGGTHVKELKELEGIKIKKIKHKKGVLKVSYQLIEE